MIRVYLTQPSCCSFSFKPLLIPSSISKLKPFPLLSNTHKKKKIKKGICRAEFSPDAPLAAAIGASMLSSLLLPVAETGEEDGGNSIIDAGDTSWVFAWLDTGKRRYAVYSILYLAPYLRSNLSLSSEDSWLPIASIICCIVHVQLEASIKNGYLQGFLIFKSREEDTHFKGYKEPEVRKREYRNLPDTEEQSRNEMRRWGIPRSPSEHHEQSNGDWDGDGGSED